MYDFRRVEGGDEIRIGFFRWPAALQVAYMYGWRPAGTQLEYTLDGQRCRDWGGLYLANSGQIITAEDAAALAGALERALNDIPDLGHIMPKISMATLGAKFLPMAQWEGPAKPIKDDRIFYPDERKVIMEVIDAQREEIGDGRDTDNLPPTLIADGYLPDVWLELTPTEKLAGCKELLPDFIQFLRGGACQVF